MLSAASFFFPCKFLGRGLGDAFRHGVILVAGPLFFGFIIAASLRRRLVRVLRRDRVRAPGLVLGPVLGLFLVLFSSYPRSIS